jgi:hypothetical protein
MKIKMNALFLAAGLLLLASVATAQPPTVGVCHIPPGNPANAHAIQIPRPAVPAHLAHGDYILDGTGICCAAYPRCLARAQECAANCNENCARRCRLNGIPPDQCQVLCVNPCVLECRIAFRECVANNCP